MTGPARFRVCRFAVHSKWRIPPLSAFNVHMHSTRGCATESVTTPKSSDESDRHRFELKLADLMESEFAEREWTESKLPDSILNELTSALNPPVLPRISRKEMHYFLKMHSNSLMPFAEALAHWMVKDDDEMEQHLDSVQKEQDVNYVATPKETKNEEESGGTKSDDIKSDDIKPDDTNSLSFNVFALYNDEELMEKMKTEYLHQFKADDLYSAAMQFYDISSPSIGRSKSASNRLSAILLVCASISGHAEAHRMFYDMFWTLHFSLKCFQNFHEITSTLHGAISFVLCLLALNAVHLGKQYLLGYGVETKYESAIYHFVRSAAMGSVDSRTFLGIMYLKGYGVKRNVSRAFTLLNESSRWMNPIAQRFLAELYEKGHHEQVR